MPLLSVYQVAAALALLKHYDPAAKEGIMQTEQ